MDPGKIVHRLSPSEPGLRTEWPWPLPRGRPGLNQWIYHAENALDWYEKEQGVEFELVGLYPYTRKNMLIIPSIDENLADWVHTCFLAKPIIGSTDDDDVIVKPTLFFAEIVYYDSPGLGFKVTHCSILDSNDPGGITYECGICDPSNKIPHSSTKEFLVGHWTYQDGEIPDSLYDNALFQDSKGGRRRLDLNKLFKGGNVPLKYARSKMISSDYAELALELHKKGQDAEFELLGALGSHRCTVFNFSEVEDWVHVSFTAKPKNADDKDASPKLFFAELLACGQERDYRLLQCSILNQPGITYECPICDPKKKIAHPRCKSSGKRPSVSGKLNNNSLEIDMVM